MIGFTDLHLTNTNDRRAEAGLDLRRAGMAKKQEEEDMTRDEWEDRVSYAQACIFYYQDVLAGKKDPEHRYTSESAAKRLLEEWRRILAKLQQDN